jgi:integrase
VEFSAREALKDVFHEVLDERTDEAEARTVQEVVDWFLARYKSTSKISMTEIHRLLRKFAAVFGPRLVSSMKGHELVAFVEAHPRIRSGWSIARWLRTIKQPFNQADRLGFIMRSPFKGVQLPRGERGRDLTAAEFQAVLRLANPYYRRVLIFLRYSGARPGELRQMTWEHVAWTPRGATIVLPRHKTSYKVHKPRKIVLPTPLVKLLLWLKRRSGAGELTPMQRLFIDEYLVDGDAGKAAKRAGYSRADQGPSLLRRELIQREISARQAGESRRSGALGVIFRNAKNGGHWKIPSLCTNFRRLRDRACLADGAKLYGCRHAFATNAILNGVDIVLLAELMGHSNTLTTNIYLHMSSKGEHLVDAAERAFGRGPIPPPPRPRPTPAPPAKPVTQSA